ncbi:hypothetical protein PP7435_CHR1-2313 [Komagataella phaffii CBS 7435]|uniref:Uncharacterized protein n=1 Tax=Komagataella phaffii (strain ATCC 76273 / CBS 7435 / CECT 11047 / NRRL Y-11430 / Wegner 21-1) TaxID=981350 RepID=A0A1G4KP94_KOMPC|nr:Hypothetical protein BQ9382_C1-3478 [Komagataella phaffii CBS 7435]SCV11834.1 hypothetical protein PP7435_CHR1-2313 [Komagataella phaffii CBS 7435]
MLAIFSPAILPTNGPVLCLLVSHRNSKLVHRLLIQTMDQDILKLNRGIVPLLLVNFTKGGNLFGK